MFVVRHRPRSGCRCPGRQGWDRRQRERVRGEMGRRRRRRRGRRGEGVGVCSGVETVLCRVPHVDVASVVVEVTKGEYQGVGGPNELVGYISGGGTGLDERDRWVAIGGEQTPQAVCRR